MRSAIPTLREIELLTKREFAELESRLTGAGVWFLPEGIDFPRGEGQPEGIEGFLSYLQEVAAENIRDQSRASAMVPITATLPDQWIEHIDKLKPVHFWSELSDKILEMKHAAVGRVAASFEIPSGLLTLGESNHWSAWAVSEEGIKRIKPYLATIADTLTRGFLIPALEREGVVDAERYAYAFDVSPLAVRPNRLDEALQLRDRFLLSDEETVKSGAFTPGQMPTEPERIKMLLFQAVTSNPQLLTDPGIQAALGIGRQAIPIQAGPAGEGPRELPPGRDDEKPVDGPPENLEDGPDAKAPSPSTARALVASGSDRALLIGAKGAVLRALEIAGSRLTSRVERKGHYAMYPRHEIHVHVGPLPVDRVDRVLDGAFSSSVDVLAADVGVVPNELRSRLSLYCLERLLNGKPHRDEDLTQVLEGLS
jgi:hypothetical protein